MASFGSRNPRIAALVGLACFLCGSLGTGRTAAAAKPPEHPAKISVSVEPSPLEAGGQARVTVSVEPIAGVKINRYPQVRLQVAGQAGLVGPSEAAVGDAAPASDGGPVAPRYFDKVEPLRLVLAVDPAARPGAHEVEGKLLFYYCVPDEFCAPHRTAVKIPFTVQ